MKLLRVRTIHLLIGIIIAAIIFPLSGHTNTESELPQLLNSCIPNEPPGIVKAVDIAAITTSGSTKYYYLYAYDEEIPENPEPESASEPNYVGYPSDLILSVSGRDCTVVYFGTPGDRVPLAEVVGQEIARQLTLNRYERVIEKIGRANFIRRVNSWSTDGGQYSLWDEEEWALEQLDITIPEALRR